MDYTYEQYLRDIPDGTRIGYERFISDNPGNPTVMVEMPRPGAKCKYQGELHHIAQSWAELDESGELYIAVELLPIGPEGVNYEADGQKVPIYHITIIR